MELLMAKTASDIAAGMVMVSYEEKNNLAFTNWMDVRLTLAKDWDAESSGSHSSSEDSNPRMSSAGLMDDLISRGSEVSDEAPHSLQGFEDF